MAARFIAESSTNTIKDGYLIALPQVQSELLFMSIETNWASEDSDTDDTGSLVLTPSSSCNSFVSIDQSAKSRKQSMENDSGSWGLSKRACAGPRVITRSWTEDLLQYTGVAELVSIKSNSDTPPDLSNIKAGAQSRWNPETEVENAMQRFQKYGKVPFKSETSHKFYPTQGWRDLRPAHNTLRWWMRFLPRFFIGNRMDENNSWF